MMFKHGVRHISTRVDVIRNGARVTELYMQTPATITMIADAQLKTYIRGQFAKNEQIDLLNDRIRPYLLIDGKEYPLGEYIVSVATSIVTSTGLGVNIEAYDQSLIVMQNRLEDRKSFRAGQRYIDIIQRLLVDCGITRVLVDDNSAVLLTDREDWEIGTSYLDIVNELLREINYNDIWFDRDGIARLHRRVAPSAAEIDHVYNANEFSIITANASTTLDIYNAPNVFVVTVSNPEYPEPLRAVSVNSDPASILSTVRRGRRIVAPLERLNNIASQTELQEYADNKRLQSMLSTESIEFQTAIVPTHGVGDIVALQHPAFSGIYQETGWDITLSAGALMRHQARRIIYL